MTKQPNPAFERRASLVRIHRIEPRALETRDHEGMVLMPEPTDTTGADQRGGLERFRHLPKPVPLADTITTQDTDPPPAAIGWVWLPYGDGGEYGGSSDGGD